MKKLHHTRTIPFQDTNFQPQNPTLKHHNDTTNYASIGFEDSTEEPIDPRAELRGGADPEAPREATETAEQDWEEAPDSYGDLEVEEVNEAIRKLEEADYLANAEEERDYVINTRAMVNQERFQTEHEADCYAEYVAMGWREPEPQDIGKVVFNRSHRRTEANLIRARATLREAYLSRHAGEGQYLL